MTVLEAIAVKEAKVAYDSARRRLEREALIEYRQGHVIRAAKAAEAARKLQRYGPSEITVIREIGGDPREGWWR